ncbi:hypothetical protein BCR34DRAFT_600257 [Clohesyomyces aquaticus]|uniref:Uncharacterized protein n=1 Tax=Clohesyomyces aquaticus TaxID=1231657 RepID=A0A1Y1ZRS1_9PLEO|nr:hypothetical protein BCR34DRAFT_600257 [Clohesyomyces aquaticus]
MAANPPPILKCPDEILLRIGSHLRRDTSGRVSEPIESGNVPGYMNDVDYYLAAVKLDVRPTSSDFRTATLPVFKSLNALHIYGESCSLEWRLPSFRPDHRDLVEAEIAHAFRQSLTEKDFVHLVGHLGVLGPTLEILELPSGYWALPSDYHWKRIRMFASADDPFEWDPDPEGFPNFKAFEKLKHLIVPCNALGGYTTIAFPIQTQPSTLEKIIIYGV